MSNTVRNSATIYIYPDSSSDPIAIASGSGISLQKTIYDPENPFDTFAEYSTDFDIEDDKYTPYLYDVLSNTQKNKTFRAFISSEGSGPLEGVVKVNKIKTNIGKTGSVRYNTNCTFWAGTTYVLSSEIAETVYELFPELTITPNTALLATLWGTSSTSTIKDYFNLFIADDGVVSHKTFRSDLVYSYSGTGKITNNIFARTVNPGSITNRWFNNSVFESGGSTTSILPAFLLNPSSDGHNFYPYLYNSAASETGTYTYIPVKTSEELSPLEANIYRVWMLRPGLSVYEIIKRVVEKGGYTLDFDPEVSQDTADKIKACWITLKNFYYIDPSVSDNTSFTPYQLLGYLNSPADYIKDILRLFKLTLKIDSGVIYFTNPKAIKYVGEIKGYVGESVDDKLKSIRVTYNTEDNYVTSTLENLGVENPLSSVIEQQVDTLDKEESEVELLTCLKRGVDAVPTGECYSPTLVNAYSEKAATTDPDLYWYYPQFLNKGFSIEWIPYSLAADGKYYLSKDEYHTLSNTTEYASPKYYRIDKDKNWVNFESSGDAIKSGTSSRALNPKSLARSVAKAGLEASAPVGDSPARPDYCFHRAPSELLCLKDSSGKSIEDSYNTLFYKRALDNNTKLSWRTLYGGFFVDGANIFINKEPVSSYQINYRNIDYNTYKTTSNPKGTIQSNFAIESDPVFRISAGDTGSYDDGFFFQGSESGAPPMKTYLKVFELSSYNPLIATNNTGIDFTTYVDGEDYWGYNYIGELISSGSDKEQLFGFAEERIPTGKSVITVEDQKNFRKLLTDKEIEIEISKAQLYRDTSINPWNLSDYENIVIKVFTKYYFVEEVESFGLADDRVTLKVREYDWIHSGLTKLDDKTKIEL